MSSLSVIAPKPQAMTTPATPGEQIVSVLQEMLPLGGAVAVCWRDWTLGSGGAVSPGHNTTLRRRAELALAGAQDLVEEDGELLAAWDNADGSARLALAAELPLWLGSAERQSWLRMARTLADAVLNSTRAQARIVKLEKSKRLQHALFEIADLAGADLEMPEMLRRIHAVVGSLMYAENCYIALYDDQREAVRFVYFADKHDPYVADPGQEWTDADMPGSLTMALLRHGEPLRGPSAQVRQRLDVPHNPAHGPDSLDWLGVPMRSDNRVRGAIVVQSYELPGCYSDEDRVLLGYVAQHILTALDRRHAHEDLERRIEARTNDLRNANRELMGEILERERAEELQRALFRITELAMTSGTLDSFYANVHEVVNELIYARNFYIALLSDDGSRIEFPYFVDEHEAAPESQLRGIEEEGKNIVQALADQASRRAHGMPAHSWLGAPLFGDGQIVGVVAVQSYTPDVSFSTYDQNLLSFVAHHIGNGLARQRGDERLRAAHVELECRVQERTRELAQANASLRIEVDERQRAEQRLIRQATHDGLTGLPNRLQLIDRISHEIRRARYGDGESFAVLFMDLDRFKLVNDSIGHDAGDEMLVEVARRITATAEKGDMVARLGGDEFVVVTSCVDGHESACELARRLLLALGAPLRVAGRELFPSVSIGIAAWNPRYRGGDELLRDADAAMYHAKAEGRTHWAMFDESMREAATRKLELEADLRRAIDNRDFLPYYQPILCMQSGEPVGHEALLRWKHETRGMVAPGEFIALGEESGLIEKVDWLLYAQVIDRLARGGRGYVSVNVSPRHFRSPDFADRLLTMLDVAGADPSQLRLEITEVALLDDQPCTMRTLRTLHEHGVLIFLDDFGTGFSALSYLHRFPISALKIDRSFVAGIGDGERPESLALVRAIVALANTLGIHTVAEGVETPVQLQALRELGCTCAQGYLLGRPAAEMNGVPYPMDATNAA